MRTTVAVIGAVAVFAAGVAVGAVGRAPDGGGPDGPDGSDPVELPDGLELAGALRSFEACADLRDHVVGHARDQVGPYGLGGDVWYATFDGQRVSDEAGAAEDLASGDMSAADPAPAAGNVVGDGVSGTNVQEQGVDEPDRLKIDPDGDTLYLVTGDRLRILDLADDEPAELAELHLSEGGWGAELLLEGDRLLVTTGGGGMIPFAGERLSDIAPRGGATTTLTVVDVSEPTEPTVTERLVLDGGVLSTRMVAGVARVVVRTDPGASLPWTYPEAGGLRAEREAAAANRALVEDSEVADWLPYYVHETADGTQHEGTLVACNRVARPEEFAGLGLLSVLTVDVGSGDLRPDEGAVGVLTGGETVYASADRLYVATQRWRDQEPWAGRGGGWSTAAPEDDVTIGRFDDRPGDREPEVTTELHAFDITDPKATEHLGSGSVDGTLLSQWAMSEHDGVLRVASTIGDPWSAASSESSVTTLAIEDGELVELGRVDGLGPTETIRAVRFIGEVGYVVTFRQTDPLYTVDLSDPTAPAVTGELKIPGYSGYLHPVGEGRLIGVGQDADEEGMTLGVQVSLFDVSDPADPRRTDTVTVPRSESTVEWDHRSFLHWPATGLTVVPVIRHFWGEPGETQLTGPASGALALKPVGDTLRPAADHAPDRLVLNHLDAPPAGASDDEVMRSYEGGYQATIQRAVVTGDRLVTVSERGVIVHDLETLADRGTFGF